MTDILKQLPNDYQKDMETAIKILKEAGCTEIYLFGSIVNGDVHENSDIDFAIRGLPKDLFFKIGGLLLMSLNHSFDLVELDNEKNNFSKHDFNFAQNLAETLDEKNTKIDESNFLSWSGDNTKKARRDMIENFADEIELYHEKNPNEQINLAGHSHGKNFNVGLANELKERGVKIDNFISLSGPNKEEYILNASNVKNYIEIFDRRDPIKNIFARYNNSTIAVGILALFATSGVILGWHLPLTDPSGKSRPYDISSVSTVKRFRFHHATRIWENIKGAF